MGWRRQVVVGGLLACGTSSSTPPVPERFDTAPACGPEAKSCGGRCASRREPELGCDSAGCAPCRLANAAPTCAPDGRCAVLACADGFGDCDGRPEDGCEVDLTATAEHCGRCGAACGGDGVCRAGECVARSVEAAERWLSSQRAGYCLDRYNKLLNLCGDVEFCFEPRFMRRYPRGLALDVGVSWEGVGEGIFVILGGDCEGKSLGIGPSHVSAFGTDATLPPLSHGKHLISYQGNDRAGAVYVDGLKVASLGPAPRGVEVLDRCGPGIVVNGRMSYWWESGSRRNWNQMAVFFVHLRQEIEDVDAYSVSEATAPSERTLFLFDESGVAGSRWTARVGGLVAVGKNAQSEDPQIDASPSGELPEWRPLAECVLR